MEREKWWNKENTLDDDKINQEKRKCENREKAALRKVKDMEEAALYMMCIVARLKGHCFEGNVEKIKHKLATSSFELMV